MVAHATGARARGQPRFRSRHERRYRPAASATLLGDRLRRTGHHARRARRRDRERRAADDRARPARLRRRIDLDRQRLSARRHDHAAAARIARRAHRLSPRLHLRAGGFHRGVARLRAVRLTADARRDARDPGLRRGRHHERERGARADDLPVVDARTRALDQRDGGRAVVGDRADGRLRNPIVRVVAVAVRGQRADRHRGSVRQRARVAGEPATRRTVRLCERADERVRVRAADHGRRRARPRRKPRIRRGRTRGRARHRLLLREAPVVAAGAAAAGRPDAHPDVRAVDRHVGRLLHVADARVRRAAVLAAAFARLLAGRNRVVHDAVAARDRVRRAARGRAVRSLLGRHPRRHRARAVRGRPAVAGDDRRASGHRRHRVADGAVRRGLRAVPVAEQSRDAVVGAARAQRRRRRDAQYRTADRPDARRRAGRIDFRRGAAARADHRALCRGGLRSRRRGGQHATHRVAAGRYRGVIPPRTARATHAASRASITNRTRAFTLARGSSIGR